MSPPTEQLVRDYLNRLSVAARGRLTADDRQALVMRTRDFIERNASPSGPATAMQVATLLSRLGDPAVLVGQELSRLAVVRGEPLVAAPDTEGRKPGVLRRRSSQASWQWPRPTGSQSLRARLLNGSAPAADDSSVLETVAASRPAAAAGGNTGGATQAAADEAPEESLAPSAGDFGNGYQAEEYGTGIEPPIWVPLQPPPADGVCENPDNQPNSADPLAVSQPGRPSWPSRFAGSQNGQVKSDAAPRPASATAVAGTEHDSQDRPESVLVLARRRGSVLLAATASRARNNPVEALAVILLGLGGVIFPPIWLPGAAVALLSRVWDYRDKWAGLAGPVLLLVIGTATGVSLGSPHASVSSYVHEGWMYADILSRVAAVLGATYLAWRLVRGRRVPAVPPWNKPHRVG